MTGLWLKLGVAAITIGLLQFGSRQNRTIFGRVWAHNAGVRGADITLTTDIGERVSQTISDSDGHFSFTGLPPGHYQVTAKLEGYVRATANVDLASVTEATATLLLHRARKLTGRPPSLGRYSLAGKAQQAYRRAAQLLRQKHLKAAIPELKSALAAVPDFAPGYELLGNIYARLRQPKRARVEWRKALQLDPARVNSAINLARYDNNRRQWQRALRRLQPPPAAAGATAPPLPWQWYWELGRAEYGSRRWSQAQSALAQAEKLDAGTANLHLLLANLAVRGHDFPHARHEFELYLQAAPHGPFAPRVRSILSQMIAQHIPEPQ